MKQKLCRIATLLLAAVLFSLTACGAPAEPISDELASIAENAAPGEATAPEERAPGESAPDEGETAVPGGEETAAAPEAESIPGTPAEVLAAYTAVMNKAKKDAKYFRKLEYQQIGKDSNFEAEWINHPAVLDAANMLMTTKDDGLKADMYTKGVTDMYADLPLYQFPVGCMVKDPGVFTRAVARQLPNGDVELTLVMKDENNPEPPAPGAKTSPSHTGEMFNPVSKAVVDDLLNGPIVRLGFWGKPPEISTRYFNCTSVLVYSPGTQRIVTLRQEYYVRINILSGKALGFINVAGYATAEGLTACDNFRY